MFHLCNLFYKQRTLDNLISKIAVKTSSGQIGRRTSFNALTRAQVVLDDALNPIENEYCHKKGSNHLRGDNFCEEDFGSYWF